MKTTRLILAAVIGIFAASAQAAVKLPQIFNTGMVLQRDIRLPVWGWADPGETVTVEFAGQKKTAQAKPDGTWMLRLDPLKTSASPAAFKVTGAANTVTFDNVVVGEVWFCSGQSNMEWSVHGTENRDQEIAAANWPLIRHFKVPKRVSSIPEADINAKWEETTPATIPGQSAVAYFFGRHLHKELGVPVGLINSSWGGTRIEPWTPPCGFDGLPDLAGIKTRVDTGTPSSPLHKQVLNDYIDAMQKWIAEARQKAAAAQPLAASPDFPQDLLLPKNTQHKQQEPTVLYNGMMAGLVPFAIRGAIWYQGCSNNGEGMLYLEKTKALVNGWRSVWGQGEFPYYLVQLAPFNYGGNSKNLPGIWEAQAAVEAAIPNAGYAVINDIGNLKDIHPRNKQDVGLRLALQALNKTYGRRDVKWSGPVYKSFRIEGNKMRITFNHAQSLKTRDGKAPDWFELCGQDGLFVKADAAIDGADIILTAPTVAAPLSMRFAWDQSAEPNLVNEAGLPAGAFRCGETPKLDGAKSSPELQGFRPLYEIDLPAVGNYSRAAPKYTLDNTAKAGDFTRVAYLLQLQDHSGSIRFVLAAMDAFTKDPAKLGIPHPASGIRHQTKVNNLTVRSNLESIPAVTDSDGGNIEFWPTNYGVGNRLNLPGANGGKYDFDDSPAGDGSYGSMQIHLWKNRLTLFAYNNFNGGGNSDIGIGNNTSGEHPDYTFMGNANQYASRRLTIYVK